MEKDRIDFLILNNLIESGIIIDKTKSRAIKKNSNGSIYTDGQLVSSGEDILCMNKRYYSLNDILNKHSYLKKEIGLIVFFLKKNKNPINPNVIWSSKIEINL